MVIEDHVLKFFAYKVACLLHDPPNKACKRHHVKEAENMAENILKDSVFAKILGRIEEMAKPADKMAASVDRWLLGKLIGEEYSLFPVREIKLKNIFNPKYCVELGEEHCKYDEKMENRFTASLNELIKDIKNPRLAYHVLYASYEASWIKHGLPTLPADTRAPTHTVFDHDYATASMMNWLFMSNDELKGVLLHVDIGGIQRFISSSRKLVDLWASSFLVSALAWSVFRVFITSFGPDVMVLPTCRGNPFYYHSLISELKKHGINEETIKKLITISSEFTKYNPEEGLPKYAVVPPTATFMLPDFEVLSKLDDFRGVNNVEEIEKFVEDLYRKNWRRVYEKTIDALRRMAKDTLRIADKVADLLKEAEKFGFNDVPPLPIRVIAVTTSEVGNVEKYFVYHEMFKRLSTKVKHRKVYKYRPEEELKLYDMSVGKIKTWPEVSKKGYEYCTVCGNLPAVMILPSDEDAYRKEVGIEFEPIFSIGERLCPYCLIKRLMIFDEVLKAVVDELLGRTSDKVPKIKFPSVSTFATLPFKKSLIEIAEKAEKNPEFATKVSEAIEKVVKKITIAKAIESLKKEAIGLVFRDLIVKVEKELAKRVEKLSDTRLKEALEVVMFVEPEDLFLRTYKVNVNGGETTYIPRADWLNLRKELMKKYGVKLENLNTFYAIVKADGDNVGSILRGEIKRGFKIDVKEYIVNALEGPAADCIRTLMENKEKALKVCSERYGELSGEKSHDFYERLEKVNNLITKLGLHEEIIISPAYHSALSRALMMNTLRDIEIVEEHEGMVIYAGGDDVLAIMPVSESLKAVKRLRISYSFPGEPKGFYRLEHGEGYAHYTPSLVDAGRSFCVYYAHFMTPLYAVIESTVKHLENFAKEAKWASCRDKSLLFEKDSVVLIYSPRGGESLSTLPLSRINCVFELAESLSIVEDFTSKVEKTFSSSLIYDLIEESKTISVLISEFPCEKRLLKGLLNRVFVRNCMSKSVTECEKQIEVLVDKLMGFSDLCFELPRSNDEKMKLKALEQLINSFRIYRSALTGV